MTARYTIQVQDMRGKWQTVEFANTKEEIFHVLTPGIRVIDRQTRMMIDCTTLAHN